MQVWKTNSTVGCHFHFFLDLDTGNPFVLHFLLIEHPKFVIFFFRFNCVATAKLLIERGANPSLVSTNGSTALHFAAHRGNDQVAELLVHHAKIDVDSKDSAYMTPLHLACVSGNAAISRMLLGQGADIRAKSTELMTPLHTAVYNGNSDVAAMILRAGGWPVQKAILADSSVIVDLN